MVTVIKKMFFTIFFIINMVMAYKSHNLVKQYFSSSDYFNFLIYLLIQIFFSILMLFFLGKVFNNTIRQLLKVDDTPMTLEKAQKELDKEEGSQNVEKLFDELK